jgi:hypothetical protein
VRIGDIIVVIEDPHVVATKAAQRDVVEATGSAADPSRGVLVPVLHSG